MTDKKKKRDKERHNLQIHLRISKSVMETLDGICCDEDDSKSEIIRKAIMQYDRLRKARF